MMKRKRIVVMGFMGSMPIAGVVWQHIHYVVGLQRLGHDVYFIEDSARLPYNPETFEVTDEFDYAAKVLARLAREFDFKNRWAYCARYLPGTPTAGMSLKNIRQLYRDADAILNVCGTQEFNDDLLVSDRILYIESDPGVEQIKIDKGVKATGEYLRRHHALFTFGENIGTNDFPVPLHGFKWLPTRQPVVTDLWKTARSPSLRGLLFKTPYGASGPFLTILALPLSAPPPSLCIRPIQPAIRIRWQIAAFRLQPSTGSFACLRPFAGWCVRRGTQSVECRTGEPQVQASGMMRNHFSPPIF
jgi:hypothetical protein